MPPPARCMEQRAEDLVTESAPLRPLTPYAESKVRVEDDVAAIAGESFSPVFLRNATAFGFSPRLRADIVLNNLVGHAVLTGDVRVLSDGTPWRPLVHARDIATAFLAALEAPIAKVHSAAHNVGTESNNLTVAEIAKSVVDVVPGPSYWSRARRDPIHVPTAWTSPRSDAQWASKPSGRFPTAPPSSTRSTPQRG